MVSVVWYMIVCVCVRVSPIIFISHITSHICDMNKITIYTKKIITCITNMLVEIVHIHIPVLIEYVHAHMQQ